MPQPQTGRKINEEAIKITDCIGSEFSLVVRKPYVNMGLNNRLRMCTYTTGTLR